MDTPNSGWHLIPSKMLSYESPVFFSKAVLKEGHLSRRVNFSERYKKVVPFGEQELTTAPVRMLWCLLLTVLPRIRG